MDITHELEMILRLLLAGFLGGLIGAERERRSNRGAGLRTHALVCTASALVMIVSAYGFSDVLSAGRIVLDPSRVAAQVVSGVGFLGAGIIIFRKNAVRGLTTAASIWAVAAIGLACGCGLFVSAISGTLVMTLILTMLKKFEQKYFPQRKLNRLSLELSGHSGSKIVSDMLNKNGLKVVSMSLKNIKGNSKAVMTVDALGEEAVFVSIFSELQALPFVDSVEYDGHALPMFDAGEGDEDAGLSA